MIEPSNSPVALRQRREQTVAHLCEHFARDHIEADDLERLIDQAYRAGSLAELEALEANLPSLDQPPRAPEEARAVARPGYAPEQQFVVALMGQAIRQGGWVPGRNIYVTALMGGACLDFRDASLDPGVTEVYVVAIMGGVEIIVPPGLRVESNGIGIMGGFDTGTPGRHPADLSAPVLRISGIAVMGGVDIREREHGENPRGRGRSHASRQALRDERQRSLEARRHRRSGSPSELGDGTDDDL